MNANPQEPGRRILRDMLAPAEGTEMDFKAVLNAYIRTPEGYAQVADWGGEGLADTILYEAHFKSPGVQHHYNADLGRQLAFWASEDSR